MLLFLDAASHFLAIPLPHWKSQADPVAYTVTLYDHAFEVDCYTD